MNRPGTISRGHSNRRLHNWLAYERGDRLLWKGRSLLRGVLFDLGCGEAPLREFFLRFASDYVGVDWPASYHAQAADIAADLNRPLPIASGVADTVVALSLLEHLCEPQTLLDEAFRILRPTGAIVIQVPWQWEIHEEPHDYYRYTPYGLEYMLGKAGFADITVEPQSGFFTMCALKFNYFTLRFVRGPAPLRALLEFSLIPLWFLAQILAPLLDRLDWKWAYEASGYYVTARKPDE